jgi:peptidylprolyl isomerase
MQLSKCLLLFLFFIGIIDFQKTFAEDEISENILNSKEEENQKNNQQLSEYVGYQMWESLQEREFQYDLKFVIKGIEKAEKGEFANLDEEKFQKLLMDNERYCFEKKSKENLLRANNFLKKIKEEEGINEVVKDRLYFQKIIPGKELKINENGTGLFHINCYTLNKKVIVNTYDQNEPTVQNLEDAIQGFKCGVTGMTEGEKRILYIHPDLGYGIIRNFEPNAMLIVEVELIKIVNRPS